MTKTVLSDRIHKVIFTRNNKVYVKYNIEFEDDSDGIVDMITKELVISNNIEETMPNLESLAEIKISQYESTLLGD